MDNLPHRVTDAQELLEWLHDALPAKAMGWCEELRDGIDAATEIETATERYWPEHGIWTLDAVLERHNGVMQDMVERFGDEAYLFADDGVERVQGLLATAAADRARILRLEAALVAYGAMEATDGADYALAVLDVLLPPAEVV